MQLAEKTHYTEDELVSLIQQGDQKAFSYLYDNYSRALFSIILRIVPGETEAEDVLQSVFLKIWNNISSYSKEKGRLYTWMLNIARNTAIDFSRSKENKTQQKNKSSDNSIHAINKEYQVNVSYDAIGLKAVLTQLKTEHQEIIDLAYYQGYTQEEIAKEMNLPLGTVKTKVRQAISKLRNLIDTSGH
jgi:RNA polymerase sigma-70 factor, ECF subfamily